MPGCSWCYQGVEESLPQDWNLMTWGVFSPLSLERSRRHWKRYISVYLCLYMCVYIYVCMSRDRLDMDIDSYTYRCRYRLYGYIYRLETERNILLILFLIWDFWGGNFQVSPRSSVCAVLPQEPWKGLGAAPKPRPGAASPAFQIPREWGDLPIASGKGMQVVPSPPLFWTPEAGLGSIHLRSVKLRVESPLKAAIEQKPAKRKRL